MITPMTPMLLYLVTKLSYLVLFAHFRSTDRQQLLHLSRKYSFFVVENYILHVAPIFVDCWWILHVGSSCQNPFSSSITKAVHFPSNSDSLPIPISVTCDSNSDSRVTKSYLILSYLILSNLVPHDSDFDSKFSSCYDSDDHSSVIWFLLWAVWF